MQRPSPAPLENRAARRLPLVGAVGLVLLGVAAYGNAFGVPFLFDDAPSIPGNPSIRHWWVLGTVLRPPHGQGITVEGRPVLNLSFAINYALGGLDVWGYHALNLLIHICAGLALYGIVRRTLERVGTGGPPVRSGSAGSPTQTAARPYLFAFVVALLWTVHPLQTESVTYIVQRAESLMGLFYLLTLYCFIRGAELDEGPSADLGASSLPGPLLVAAEETRRRQPTLSSAGAACQHRPGKGAGAQIRFWFLLSFLACLLGMGTKEDMVSAPVLVLLYDRSFVGGSFREAWRRRKRLYLALGSTWLLLGWLVLGSGSRGGTVGAGSHVSSWQYALTQFQAVSHYLWLAVWPSPLIFDYGVAWVRGAGDVLPYVPVVLALVLGTAWALRRRPGLGLLGFGFLAVLAPTSSVIPGNRQTLAEHRMYLPLAAVLIGLGLGLGALAARLGVPPKARRAAALGLGLAAAFLGVFLTARRNRDYRSALALYADTVAKRPDNAFARYNLGKTLDEAGQPAAAVPQYLEAIRLRPGLVDSYYNLGNSLSELGRKDEAMAAYEAALRLKPDDAEAEYNLGNVLVSLGRKSEAMPHYRAALAVRPDYVEARDNLGSVLLDLGRLPEAMAEYREVLRVNPNLCLTHYNLGSVYRLLGRRTEAIEQYEIALRLKPGFAPARAALDALNAPPAP